MQLIVLVTCGESMISLVVVMDQITAWMMALALHPNEETRATIILALYASHFSFQSVIEK